MLGTEVCLLTLPSSPELSEILIAERLSARQLIPHCISEIVSMYVCLYPSRLGIQLFPALRANVCARAPV